MTSDTRTVLVTTDGSAHSRRILPHANVLARALGSSLLLTECFNPKDAAREPGESDEAALARATDALLATLHTFLGRSSINGEAVIAIHHPDENVADVIVRLADERAADLIAMDTRGYSALHHALQGSTALSVLARTRRPVMLSGAELGDVPVDNPPYRIVATSDGSPASEDVLRALAPVLVPGKFSVLLLRVVERPPAGEDEAGVLRAAEEHLQRLVPILPRGLDVQTKVREIVLGGGVDTAIIEEAEALHANAIAMSTHGVSARTHLLAGNTALTLLGRSPLPVIMARSST